MYSHFCTVRIFANGKQSILPRDNSKLLIYPRSTGLFAIFASSPPLMMYFSPPVPHQNLREKAKCGYLSIFRPNVTFTPYAVGNISQIPHFPRKNDRTLGTKFLGCVKPPKTPNRRILAKNCNIFSGNHEVKLGFL